MVLTILRTVVIISLTPHLYKNGGHYAGFSLDQARGEGRMDETKCHSTKGRALQRLSRACGRPWFGNLCASSTYMYTASSDGLSFMTL